MGAAIALDRVTSLSVDRGVAVLVQGTMTTSIDGTEIDAVMQRRPPGNAAPQPGGLFDLEAGGFRIIEQHPERHEYVLVASGNAAPGCSAKGAGAPCLVPRIADLAHERLRARDAFAATLSGRIEVAAVLAAPAAPWPAARLGRIAAACALSLLAAAVLGLVVRWVRLRGRTPMGRIRASARTALAALRGDVTLDPVRGHIDLLLRRAFELESARQACDRRLGRIDFADLERRREASSRSPSPEAREALAWIDAEAAEAHRLRRDRESAKVGLERIASALAVVPLRAREHRDVRARLSGRDPVDALAEELGARDDAMVDVDANLRR
jgi:hypothetical protein